MKTSGLLLNGLALLLISGMLSCEKKDGNPGEDEPDPIKENIVVTPDFLDIADAKSLVVINEGTDTKSGLDDPHSNGNLYKIKDKGEIVKVMFRDQNGKPFEKIVYYKENGDSIVNYPQLTVNEINELSDDFLLVEGSFSYLDISDLENPHDVFYQSLLLRHSDGALFDFDDQINWYRSCRYKNRYLYSDNDGNIYYTSKSSEYNVQKLTMLENGGISRENIFPFTLKFKEYCVDGEGNLFYVPDEPGSTFEGFHVKVANGGILPFDREFIRIETSTLFKSMYTEFHWLWIGEDKEANMIAGMDSMIFNEEYNEWDNMTEGIQSILQLNVDYSTVDYAYRFQDIRELSGEFSGEVLWYIDFYVYRTRYLDETIFIYGNVGSEPVTKLWALDIKNQTYRNGIIPINEGEYVESIIQDGAEFIYLGINSKLLKISKKDFSFTNFLPENQYDIFDYSVSENDIVTFNALRYSDAKIILGEIDLSGKITIIKDDMTEPVTSLVRIN